MCSRRAYERNPLHLLGLSSRTALSESLLAGARRGEWPYIGNDNKLLAAT